MKRKVSIAFIFFLLTAILSVKPVISDIGDISNMIRYLAGLNVTYILRLLLYLVKDLIPFAVVVLLVLNSKRDVKKSASLVLLLCAIVSSACTLLSLPGVIRSLSDFYTLLRLPGKIAEIFVAIMLFMSYVCVKNGEIPEKTRLNLGYVAIGGAIFGIFAAFVMMFIEPYAMRMGNTFVPGLMVLSIYYLPKTILDYENCVILNQRNFKRIVTVLVIAVVAWVVFSSSGGATCAKSGCSNKAVSSGDSVYCSSHSSRCLNCGCYVDYDAAFCMDCIRGAMK